MKSTDPVALTKGLEALLMRQGIAYGDIQGMTATERTETIGALAAVSELENRQEEEARWFASVSQHQNQAPRGGVFLGQ